MKQPSTQPTTQMERRLIRQAQTRGKTLDYTNKAINKAIDALVAKGLLVETKAGFDLTDAGRACDAREPHVIAENALHLSDDERARVLAIREADRRRRRISEIEDSLARPVEEGREWDRRRAQLEAELDVLRQAT